MVCLQPLSSSLCSNHERNLQWLEADEFAPILPQLDFSQSPDLLAEKLLISTYLHNPDESNLIFPHLVIHLRDTYHEHGEIIAHLNELLNTNELVSLVCPKGLPDPIRLGWLRKGVTRDVLERPLHKVQSLTNLAKAYQYKKDYEREIAVREADYATLKETLGTPHPDTINSLKHLAKYYIRGDIPKAQALYQEALNFQKEILGPQHLEIALTLGDFAFAQESYGQHNEAITICRELYGDDHLHTAKAMVRLGDNYEEDGMHQQSLPLYEAALEVFVATLGRRHSDTGVLLGKLGSVYGSFRDEGREFALYEEQISIYRETLGDRHRKTVHCIRLLGYLYQRRGDHAKALPLIDEALEVLRSHLGETHFAVQKLQEEREECQQALANPEGSATDINA